MIVEFKIVVKELHWIFECRSCPVLVCGFYKTNFCVVNSITENWW